MILLNVRAEIVVLVVADQVKSTSPRSIISAL